MSAYLVQIRFLDVRAAMVQLPYDSICIMIHVFAFHIIPNIFQYILGNIRTLEIRSDTINLEQANINLNRADKSLLRSHLIKI